MRSSRGAPRICDGGPCSRMTPPSRKQTRFAISRANAISCVAMSIVIAAIYGLVSLWLPLLATMWIAAGLAYGVGIFVVMTYVVIPLSAAPSRPLPGMSKIGKDLLAMLGFGLIIAYTVHRASF